MLATGLRDDDLAVDSGADWVARQVRDGRRALSLDDIRNAVSELRLDASRPGRAVLSIATLKPDPLAADADYALDWVDRFDGASAFLKRRPLSPATWGEFRTELEAIPAQLPAGTTAVVLTGSIRQASAFAVGAALRQVTGVSDLAVKQRGQLWSSDQHYTVATKPEITEHHLGQGDDLAVAVAVAVDPTDDVLEYLRAEIISAAKLLVMAPIVGTRDNAIPDPSSAIALAVGIRDHARSASRNHPRIHLFLAGPMGLAALLGHRWNRVRPTTVYEDVQAKHTYEPAFSIDA